MEKVKLIIGSEERSEEIRKTLEEWGGTNRHVLSFKEEETYYYLDQLSICNCIDEEIAKKLISEGKAEIYKLPAKCDFKPFEKVLVRNLSDAKWRCDFFSHTDEDTYVCVAYSWKQCIQYEGNEALLGTTDNPK